MDIPRLPMPAKEPEENTKQQEKEELCPSCGYFVGAKETCVRCGARTGKRLEVKLIKRISIYGSIIGLILLWIAAYAKKPQQINISDINELMNGALIKIVGTVSSVIQNEERNTLKMKIDDGTGEISANAYNKLRQFKKVLGSKFPGIGDKVEIVGTINVSQKFGATMFLSVPDRVHILEKFELKVVNIGDLSLRDVGHIYLLHCWISDYKPMTTKRGSVLHRYTLTDKTGSIETVVFEGMMEKMTPKQKKVFERWGYYKLEILVKIDEYRKKLQANILDPSKIKKLKRLSKSTRAKIRSKHKSSPVEASLSTPVKKYFRDITQNDIGKVITVNAEVRYVNQKNKGTLLTLDDGTASLKVMVWDSDQAGIKGFEYLGRGDRVNGVFKVDEYKGKLQLKIVDPHRIKIVSK